MAIQAKKIIAKEESQPDIQHQDFIKIEDQQQPLMITAKTKSNLISKLKPNVLNTIEESEHEN